MKVIKEDWRNIVRGIGLRIAETAGYAVSITYMISYLKNAELATKSETLTALCIASAIGIFATMGWARLTDKIGRRTVYIWVCAFAIPFGVLMFVMVNTGIFLLIIATFVMAYCVIQNSLAGAQGGWFPELFTANTRASGASLAYQISAMVSGFTPFITTLLFVSFGWMGPALLFSGYTAIGLVAAMVTRETWGPRERQLADEAAAADTRSVRHQARRLRRFDDNHRQDRPPPAGGGGRLPDAPPRAQHGRGPGAGLCRAGPGRRRHAGQCLRRPTALPRR